jgi:hypothetical protein
VFGPHAHSSWSKAVLERYLTVIVMCMPAASWLSTVQ